jgi:hypothetical protein
MLKGLDDGVEEIERVSIFLIEVDPCGRGLRSVHVGSSQGGLSLCGLPEDKNQSFILIFFEKVKESSPVQNLGQLGRGDLRRVGRHLHREVSRFH